MSATVLLLKTQTRLLAWPFLVLLAAWLISAIVPLDAVDVLLGIAVILAGALAGPIVFGAEYMEGAREYLSTRPVSPRSVFWSKVILLFLIAWLSAIIIEDTIRLEEILHWDLLRIVDKPARLLFPIVLSLSLWMAFCTVICRDLVRGLLYGGISFTILAALVGVLQWMFFEAYRPPINIRFLHTQGYVFQALLLATAPLLVLGLLQSAFVSQTKHRIRLGWFLPVALASFIGALSLAAYSMKHEGSASLHVYGGRTGMAAAAIRDDRLLAVFKDEDKLWMRSLDLTDPELIHDPEWRARRRSLGIARDGIICEDTVIIFPRNSESRMYAVAFYRVDDSSALSFIRRHENIFHTEVTQRGALKVVPGDGNPWFLVNLTTGMIGDVTTTARFPDRNEVLQVGQKGYGYNPETFSGWVEWRDRFGDKRARRFNSIVGPAVDEDLFAGFHIDPTPGEYRLLDRTLPALLPHIRLHSASPMKGFTTSIPIPIRLVKIFRDVTYGLNTFFTSPVGKYELREGTYVRLTLGGGYLCLWVSDPPMSLHRVAVWDVNNAERPDFLGIFPSCDINITSWHERHSLSSHANHLIQPPLEPIERDDGALGFPIYDNQVLWLEIPERMKEPQT